MLAPLLFVWPISIALTHYFANSVASYPYDQALREHVSALARQVVLDKAGPQLLLSQSARALLRSDEVDNVYFRVGTLEGRQIGGDAGLPLMPTELVEAMLPGSVYFRDAEYKNDDVRFAYTLLSDPALPKNKWALVEVGETLEKRSQLANKIIASVIVPQFIIIPLAVLLVWFGLSKGLQPLTRLREAMQNRRAGDMALISTQRVPEELAPLVETFNSMLERVQRNMAVQQRFIADAAHQMRTPLTGLKTQAQLALREPDPAMLRTSLVQIATSVDRAAHLVNQLLTLARTEGSDQAQHQHEAMDLNPVLREMVEDWVMQAVSKEIDLGFEAAKGPAMIWGNAFLLRELSKNLIDNALRYTPRGGTVTIRLVAHGDFILLEIEDNGIGISEEQSELVFERFYRVSDSGVEGSGLGLSIVREIATQHRASVSLRPNPKERGTVARVVFPTWHKPADPLLLPPPTQTGFA